MKTISERALELARQFTPDEYKDMVGRKDVEERDILQALDEWQRSVEERLASIGLGAR